MKINRSSHATFKMDKCEDGHTPTCNLDNKENLLSHMLAPYSTWKCFAIRMLIKTLTKPLPISVNFILLCRNNRHMEVCPN